jgi:hypothetical protein
MIRPDVESRGFFNERIAKYYGGDRVKAETVPIEAFLKAVMEVKTTEDAENFLAGHLHWLRGKKPQTLDNAFATARSNLNYCFEEPKFPKAARKVWDAVLECPVFDNTQTSPEAAFKSAQLVGQKLKEGKDVGALASLAKKALAKKAGEK